MPRPLRTGGPFLILGMTQAKAGRWKDLSDSIQSTLDSLAQERPGFLAGVDGPHPIMGSHDFAFRLHVNDLELGARALYTVIDDIAADGALLNFRYVYGFSWMPDSLHDPQGRDPVIGFLLVKWKKRAFAERRMLTEEVYSLLEEYRGASADLGFQMYGGLSWHELICAVTGRSFHALMRIAEVLQRLPSVQALTVLPVIPWSSSIDLSGTSVLTRIGARPETAPPELPHGCEAFRSGIDSMLLLHSPSSGPELLTNLAKLDRIAELGHHETELLTSISDRVGRGPDSSAEPRSGGARSSPQLLKRIEDVSLTVAHRKLEALLTQIRLMEADPRTNAILPGHLSEGISEVLTYHEKGKLSEQGALYYVSEIQAAILERLTGATLSNLETWSPPIRHRGGSQRLTIACEQLLKISYRYYLDELARSQHLRTPGEDVRAPIVLTFFDYNEGSPPRPAVDMERLVGYNLPLIIRLPMLLYKPWLWGLGIGALTECVWPTQRAGALAGQGGDLYLGRAPADQADHLAAQFLTKRNLKATLAEHLNVFKRGADGMFVNLALAGYVNQRVGAVSCITRRHPRLREKMETFSAKLGQGEAPLGISQTYEDWVAFINGYLSLPPEAKRGAAAMSAFVVALNKATDDEEDRSGA